jgi:5,10-methylenetetrahydromethanopterin reductase
VKFGVGILGTNDVWDLVGTAKAIEELEYDNIWIPDERFYREAYVKLALCALNTERVKLGTGVTDPYSRHPALTAVAIATVDEVSGGRTILGMGAGASGFETLCIERRKPALAIREAVKVIRDLLKGKEVSYDGQIVKVRRAKLNFEAKHNIPIYIAGRGPKILKLAGEVADGAIIGGLISREGLKYAFKQVEKGVKKSARHREAVDIVSWSTLAMSDRGDEAKKLLKPMVVTIMRISEPILDSIGIEENVSKPILHEYNRAYASGLTKHEAELKATKFVSNELVNKFAFAGSPDEIIDEIEELQRAGVRQVVILPRPGLGKSLKEVAERFADDVMSQFK